MTQTRVVVFMVGLLRDGTGPDCGHGAGAHCGLRQCVSFPLGRTGAVRLRRAASSRMRGAAPQTPRDNWGQKKPAGGITATRIVGDRLSAPVAARHGERVKRRSAR